MRRRPLWALLAHAFSYITIATAAVTRLPLTDAVSDSKADSKHNQDQKSDWIHDTSPVFLSITPEQGRRAAPACQKQGRSTASACETESLRGPSCSPAMRRGGSRRTSPSCRRRALL